MFARKKILIADDDPDVVQLLTHRLRQSGYDVESAPDGVSCMAQVLHQNPDLLVLDLGLPAGDGYLTLERLRGNASFSSLPVVVLTGRRSAQAREHAMAVGATAFFQKSVGRDEFLGTIDRLTEGEQ